MKEKLLSRQSKENDCSTFWQLWLLHEKYLYRRCLSWMSGNINDAQDAIAQARLKAWEKFPIYQDKIQDPKAWLIRLTHNLCMDFYRHKNRKVLSLDEMIEFSDDALKIIKDTVNIPGVELEKNELEFLISSAIDALPDSLRTPFILRFVYELSYQEISQKLSIKVDSLYKMIQKARQLLRRQLSGYINAMNFVDMSKDVNMKRTSNCVAEGNSLSTNNSVELIRYSITALCLERPIFVEFV